MTSDNKIRVIIVGAGKAGELVSKDIIDNKDSSFDIVGFVDDSEKKQKTKVNGISVLGKVSELPKLISNNNVEELLIAIPSERGKKVRDIIELTSGAKISYKILPRLSEVLMQDFNEDYIKYIRKVKAEDLLGGEILKSDQHHIAEYTKGQVVLITGAAGSIGSELSRQLAAYNAKQIIYYDWWENGMFDLRNQIIENYPDGNFEFIIGDVKDRKKLDLIMKKFKPDAVFHAAAYKHVPLMEDNAAEAIKNNIVGTRNVAELSVKYGVNKFILISTDKAVNPTNIMGATKRSAEQVIHILAESQSDTTLCSVRFGNVINSNGSAIPIFEKQIEKGGPVTVTHKDITRFFMTIPEAVHLILQAWVMGENNDLFVLDMGEPIKIYDLAKLLIALHGYVPEEDVKIKITGLRPGEKLYEEVLVKEEETSSTAVKKIFKTKNYMNFNRLSFIHSLNMLIEIAEDGELDIDTLKSQLKKTISTYRPNSN